MESGEGEFSWLTRLVPETWREKQKFSSAEYFEINPKLFQKTPFFGHFYPKFFQNVHRFALFIFWLRTAVPGWPNLVSADTFGGSTTRLEAD